MSDGADSRQNETALPMRRPLLALACVFAIGVWFAGWVGVSSSIPWILDGVLLIIALVMLKKRLGGVLRFYLWLMLFASLGWSRGVLPEVPTVKIPQNMVVLSGVAQNGWSRINGGLQVVLGSCAIGEPGGKMHPWPGKVRMKVLLEPGQHCPQILPGDEIRALVRMAKPYATHNFQTMDTREALYSKGIYWTSVAVDCHGLLVSEKKSLSPVRLAQDVRYALDRLVSQAKTGSRQARALYSALSFGETGYISPETRLEFQRAGLAHLLAVSGLHLGTVAIGLYLFLSFLLCRIRPLALRMDVRRVAAGLVIPAVGFYVFLVGARLPAIRASVVIFCFLLAIILRRKSDSLNVLSAAWLLILGLWPQSLFNASFQLSFGAALAVVIFVPRWATAIGVSLRADMHDAGLFRMAINRISQLALVSLAATVGTAPVLVWHFHQVSLSGLLSNLFAVPLASWFVVPVGIMSAVSLSISSSLAGAFAYFGIWLCQGLGWLADFFSGPSWASINVAGLGIVSMLAWYLCWILATLKWRIRWIRYVAVLGFVYVCAVFLWQSIGDRFSNELRLTAIDVGQGDCLLVRFPGGAAWLVDGGGTYSGRFDVGMGTVAPALWALGVDKLDVVVATHRDPDHVGGLASIVHLFHPREVWSATNLDEDDFSKDLFLAATSEGVEIRKVHEGMHFEQPFGVDVDVLWPPEDNVLFEENERSIVIRISYGAIAMLLTGDLEKQGEKGLVESGAVLKADVLKVGHHGSANATGKDFLDRVEPGWAVISVGARNHFGLPRVEVLQRLNAAGVQILRTDRDGQVTFRTDGKELMIDTWRKGDMN